jgi:hypothetical protein
VSDLFGAQVPDSVPQQPADLVQRLGLVPVVAEDVLLHAAAGLVDHLGAELDHVERVQHGDCVVRAVADRLGLPAEGVQRVALGAGPELGGLGGPATPCTPFPIGRG